MGALGSLSEQQLWGTTWHSHFSQFSSKNCFKRQKQDHQKGCTSSFLQQILGLYFYLILLHPQSSLIVTIFPDFKGNILVNYFSKEMLGLFHKSCKLHNKQCLPVFALPENQNFMSPWLTLPYIYSFRLSESWKKI